MIGNPNATQAIVARLLNCRSQMWVLAPLIQALDISVFSCSGAAASECSSICDPSSGRPSGLAHGSPHLGEFRMWETSWGVYKVEQLTQKILSVLLEVGALGCCQLALGLPASDLCPFWTPLCRAGA